MSGCPFFLTWKHTWTVPLYPVLTHVIFICQAFQYLVTVIWYDKGMWFSHDDLKGRIWQYSSSRVSGCRKTFPSLCSMWNVCQMPYSSAYMHCAASPTFFMHLEGAQQEWHTVYLRQIVNESEDVIILPAKYLQRTNAGNEHWHLLAVWSTNSRHGLLE